MTFVLPSKAQVGYLSPEIAGEGQKVILSDGEQVNWTPPPPRPVMPDWSQIKSIARYFNRSGGPVYPAWLYHPTEEPRIVKSADEAAQLGVCYRKATADEHARFGQVDVWDWTEDSKWRPKPYGPMKFDPHKLGTGKIYQPGAPNPGLAQNQLLEALIPTVTAAVVTALKSAGGVSAPASVDAKQWDAFLEFQAWQKTKEAVEVIEQEVDGAPNALNALDPDQERELWSAEAERKGIKVDGRWSLERLKSEIEKAA